MKQVSSIGASNGALRITKERRPRKQAWRLLVGIGVLLLLVGGWTYHAVQETIHDNLTEGLQTILQANIEALQIVVANERGQVQVWAKDAMVRSLTEQLLSGGSPEETSRKLTEELDSVLAEDGYLGYAIIDAEGVIRATDQPDAYLGKTLSPEALKLLGPVLAGGSSFEKPLSTKNLIQGVADVSERPVLMAKAAIADNNGKNIAALVFTIDPEKDFTRILSVAEFGSSGTTYAFDAQGLMLSESRHEQQLKQLGLIPDGPDSSAILKLQLRDPGVDLTKGKAAVQPLAARPLTRMAEAAVNGSPGIDVDGYRDYRGVEVVGAWQWLPDYGFGVATELERNEALRSLRPVRLAFAGLFGLLVITAGGVLISGHLLNRLQTEIEELRDLGQYTLVEKIGEGGMGKVYKARHAMLRRPTAIKLIREEQLDEQALERFEQEVQLTSQLSHPNTISIYDYGHSPDGVFYYAMEYLSGITLEQLVKIEKRLPAERVIYLLQQICGSLAEAHGQGLIHRDIKPGNIMLCQRGGEYDAVKVLDFGLVREISPAGSQEPEQAAGIMGTPGFIAPELLVSGRQVDTQSDLYAVGALGFLLLTGQLMFSDADIDKLLHKVVNTDPPRPSQFSDIPLAKVLDDLIYACLARQPEERPASAKEIAEKLAAIPLERSWTQQDALTWWQENSTRIEFERKQGRPDGSGLSATVLDIDFGERV